MVLLQVCHEDGGAARVQGGIGRRIDHRLSAPWARLWGPSMPTPALLSSTSTNCSPHHARRRVLQAHATCAAIYDQGGDPAVTYGALDVKAWTLGTMKR